MLRTILVLAAIALPCAAESKMGKPLELKSQTAIQDVLASPARFVGKPLQVKGKITEVCQMMGCWTNLVDENGKMLKVKVNDGDIVFPKDAVGKMAIAEGSLKKLELTREQAVERARHEAEEQGRKFNAASVKSGTVLYLLMGSGAVILD